MHYFHADIMSRWEHLHTKANDTNKRTNERTLYDKITHIRSCTIYYTIMSVLGKWENNAVHETGIMDTFGSTCLMIMK